jgi:D-amino-acid dehydrogenase
MAHIAIVGAGVIGCASAWALTRVGHKVTLIDKAGTVCGGASARNGAQLSYAYGDALASPGLLSHMPAILMRRDPAFRVWLSPDPEFLIWSLRFLRNSTPARFRANTTALLNMAARTQILLPDVVRQYGLSFDYAASGKMILYPDSASLEAARASSRLKAALGITQHFLTRDEATRIEPALAHYRDNIEGVVYSPHDAAGRPTAFCEGLVAGLAREGSLDLKLGTEVRGLQSRNSRVTGLVFQNRPPLFADAVVIATGHGRLPTATPRGIWPVQGYSITVAAGPGAMRTSITDLKRKLVFARLGDHIRIAGIADIASRKFTFRPDRFTALMDGASAAFANGFDLSGEVEPWSEARPCTPSSQPLIGPGRAKGLFVNLGHGTLGWTLCLGAAESLANCINKSLV